MVVPPETTLLDKGGPRRDRHSFMDSAQDQPAPGPSGALNNQQMVVEFLRHRSTPCPTCGYDLANSPNSVCSECGTQLVLSLHPIQVTGPKLAAGMTGVIVGLVMSVVRCLVSLGHGSLLGALASVILFSAAVVQLSLYERYFRMVRSRRRQLLGVYALSGWSVPAIIILWFLMSR